MKDYEIYKKGMEEYRQNNYFDAMECFKKLVNKSQYRFKALRMILMIYKRQYRFRDVRDIINEEMNPKDYNTMMLLSDLEFSEHNLNASLNLLNQCKKLCKNVQNNFGVSMKLVDTYINNGEFNKARSILREISELEIFTDEVLLKYIMLDIILDNYERAISNFEKIDFTKLDLRLRTLYERVYSLLSFKLGYDLAEYKFTFNYKKSQSNVYKNTLIDSEEFTTKLLVKRIDKNKELFPRNLKFARDLDSLEFVMDVKEKIKMTNPLYVNFKNVYNFNFPYRIGDNGEEEIYGVSVETVIGTDKIISILPALYSEELDIENLNRDKNLRKRLMLN